jgi:hypothetical protein
MSVEILKGGSLSQTSLHTNGKKKFVRKEIATKENREYGFVRWYSQLKKLQRFGNTEVFPKVLNVSVTDNTAYFDLEFLEGYKDIKTIFTQQTLSTIDFDNINEALLLSFSKIHDNNSYVSNKGSAALYFKEEVLQRLEDAIKVKEFSEFFNLGTYQYNGTIVHGLTNYLNEMKNFFDELQFISEQDIHGNPTLENIMYSFDENRVIFVDPYEESILDTRFLDYSQVFQCSRSCYGYINDRYITVNGTYISHNLIIPDNFKTFNKVFESNFGEARLKEIMNVLEATQFIRMLPFKCLSGNIDKAKYFYVHACYLLNKIFK